jgi:branched-chain amino acid aminotransferase
MNTKNYIILDGLSIEQGEYFEPTNCYYEVVRLLSGALLFWEEHVDRLKHSFYLNKSQPHIDSQLILEDVKKLIEKNGYKDQNIKIAFYSEFNMWKRAVYFIPSNYPTSEMYTLGVGSKTIAFEREHPDIKRMSDSLQKIRQKLQRDSVFDYICVDRDNFISEGTKTNVFFVVGNSIITASDLHVLGGITRKIIVNLANEIGTLDYKRLSKDAMKNIDAAFFTGTSIGVLPINQIDNTQLNSANNQVVIKLMDTYQKRCQDYIRNHKFI